MHAGEARPGRLPAFSACGSMAASMCVARARRETQGRCGGTIVVWNKAGSHIVNL
jgi:hypothetical protein